MTYTTPDEHHHEILHSVMIYLQNKHKSQNSCCGMMDFPEQFFPLKIITNVCPFWQSKRTPTFIEMLTLAGVQLSTGVGLKITPLENWDCCGGPHHTNKIIKR